VSLLVWVIYDVSEDKIRGKVASLCKRQGLYRVQKSVFLGKIEPNRLDELLLASEQLIDGNTDSVYVFPLCRSDFGRVKIIGQGFDKRLVQDQIKALVV